MKVEEHNIEYVRIVDRSYWYSEMKYFDWKYEKEKQDKQNEKERKERELIEKIDNLLK